MWRNEGGGNWGRGEEHINGVEGGGWDGKGSFVGGMGVVRGEEGV